MKKLAIIITHPIQYHSPVFQLLAKQCNLKIFYTLGESSLKNSFDPGFKKTINWGIPLLEGYNYSFLENKSKIPGSDQYKGIDNPTLIKEIEDFKPNAILVYGWSYKSHLKAIRYFNGKIPLWFRGDSNLLGERIGLKRFIRHLFLKWVYGHIDKAFYVGVANKAYYEAFGLKTAQLIFAPHAIDNDRFSQDRSIEVRQLRESLHIKANEYLILFAGKFEPTKNPEILLNAFIELNKTHVHLLLVGNGILEETLKFRVERNASTTLSMTNRIHFMDFQNQNQMPVIYQACDLFCLPSIGETWGLAVNEAMACGKAILVSDQVGCAMDLVKENINGSTFEARNISSLKKKLSILLETSENLKEMGKKSANEIKKWSIEKQAEIIINELNAAH